MSAFKMPISNQAGTVSVGLNGKTYKIRTVYADSPSGGWSMDISDASGVPLLCGIPLVTGTDLLGQYRYLGIGGRMFVTTVDPAANPTFDDFGVSSFVWFEPYT